MGRRSEHEDSIVHDLVDPVPGFDEHPAPLSAVQVSIGLTDHRHGRALRDRLVHPQISETERNLVDRQLVTTAFRIIKSMTLSGEIFSRFARLTNGSLGGGSLRDDLRDHHDLDDLVHEAVAAGLMRFHHNLATGAWKADRGAALQTYLVNICVIALKGPYRRWLTSQANRQSIERAGLAIYQVADLADVVVLQHEINSWLERPEMRDDRRLLIRVAQGYSQKEIAKEFGLSVRTVGYRLQRLRERWQEYIRERDSDD